MRGAGVVVTGVGAVSPLGTRSRQHFDAWAEGRSAVAVASAPEFKSAIPQLEARVRGFERSALIKNRMLRKLLSPSAGYALGAAGEAIADAGLAGDPALEACGLYVGSLSLEIDPEVFVPPLRASLTPGNAFDISLFAKRGMKLLDPLFLVRALPNAGVCGISVEHQVLGPNTNLTNGYTSGLMAVGLSLAAIQRGEADCAVAGGYDTLLGMDSLAEHLIADRLSTLHEEPARACRPFDRERRGYVLGEGAAFVVLESAAHARARGARVYAELLSYAETTDVGLLERGRGRDATGLRRASARALADAECPAGDVAAIFGDGLGTVIDDLREADAIRAQWPEPAAAFTAATSAIGFTGAASGVFSLVHAAMAMERHVLPALYNCDDPDPDCGVYFLPRPERRSYRRSLVWTSDRGVKNAALVIGAPPS
jgi:3-oxoacyl-(acyl-carrier-protein) synthase